jgi:hypothetical protein
MNRSRVLAVVALALALPSTAITAGATPAGAATPAVGPGCQIDRRTTVHAGETVRGRGAYVPCLIDTGMTSGEAGLAITGTGTILRSMATGPPGIAVSADQGATWRRRPLPSGAQTFIADGIVDADTGRYLSTGAFGAPIFASDDAGVTWTKGALPAFAAATDWPKLFTGRPVHPRTTGYRNNVYECNWTIPLGIVSDTECFVSTDGARTFRATGSAPYRFTDCPTGWEAAQHGRGVVDPRDGTIYLPASFCGKTELAVSHDEGKSWEHRTIQVSARTGDQTLADSDQNPGNRRQRSEGRFNVVTAELASRQVSDALAMDGSGRLYATWIDDHYFPVVSMSGDHGRTWSIATRLSPPGVVQGVLPAIAVTPGGRVGVSYYATTDKWNWTGYLTIVDGLESDAPALESASATRPGQPLMNEPCCWVSGPQEYTAARWAPDGSLWAAFAAYTSSGDAEGMLGRLVHDPS